MQNLPIGHLIEQYGYIITFIGTVLEGESVLVLSAIAAHLGYLSLPIVILVATMGGTLGDVIGFLLGRKYGHRLIARFPSLAHGTNRTSALVERFPNASIIIFRFIYGLKLSGAVLIGMSKISTERFLILNFIGSFIWAASITGIAYTFAATLTYTLGNIHKFQKDLLIIVLIVGAVYVGTVLIRKRREEKNEKEINDI